MAGKKPQRHTPKDMRLKRNNPAAGKPKSSAGFGQKGGATTMPLPK